MIQHNNNHCMCLSNLTYNIFCIQFRAFSAPEILPESHIYAAPNMTFCTNETVAIAALYSNCSTYKKEVKECGTFRGLSLVRLVPNTNDTFTALGEPVFFSRNYLKSANGALQIQSIFSKCKVIANLSQTIFVELLKCGINRIFIFIYCIYVQILYHFSTSNVQVT